MQDEREPPADEREREEPLEPAHADERERCERSDEATEADHRVQQADPALAQVEEVDRDDDDERGEQAAHEDLGDEAADHEGRTGVAPEDGRDTSHVEAGASLVAPAVCVRVVLEADPGDGSGGRGEACRDQQSRRRRPRRGDEQSGEQRTAERADALADARRDIGCDELARATGERRQEAQLDGADERAGARNDRGEREQQLDRQSEPDDRSGCEHPRAAREVDRRERDVTAHPSDERGREGRDEDLRHDAHGAEQTDRECPTLVICDDKQHHEKRPVRSDAERPGEHDPSQRAASQHVARRGDG